jgi:hypothetical protein
MGNMLAVSLRSSRKSVVDTIMSLAVLFTKMLIASVFSQSQNSTNLYEHISAFRWPLFSHR